MFDLANPPLGIVALLTIIAIVPPCLIASALRARSRDRRGLIRKLRLTPTEVRQLRYEPTVYRLPMWSDEPKGRWSVSHTPRNVFAASLLLAVLVMLLHFLS